MSYDIYGNPLRAGYCEVHPDEKGTYPECPACEDEYYRRYREGLEPPYGPPEPEPEPPCCDSAQRLAALVEGPRGLRDYFASKWPNDRTLEMVRDRLDALLREHGFGATEDQSKGGA